MTTLVLAAVICAVFLPKKENEGGALASAGQTSLQVSESVVLSGPPSLTSTDSSSATSFASPSGKADLSRTVFVGNSFVEDLSTYNLLPESDCFARVGLNVRSALEKPTLRGTVPVIDELNDREYERVILVFGENELGWNSAELFAESYAVLIDEVRARQPAATLYISSIFPVSAEVSEKNVDQTNNQRIAEFNRCLETLAGEKDAVFLDGASVMRDESGALPSGAATDGIHPSIDYYKKWVSYIKSHI